jgi:lysophospholipid acyltransferase (LPLAT)-like uncharacterized protein
MRLASLRVYGIKIPDSQVKKLFITINLKKMWLLNTKQAHQTKTNKNNITILFNNLFVLSCWLNHLQSRSQNTEVEWIFILQNLPRCSIFSLISSQSDSLIISDLLESLNLFTVRGSYFSHFLFSWKTFSFPNQEFLSWGDVV